MVSCWTPSNLHDGYANKVILCCLIYSCLLLMVCPKCWSSRYQENAYMAYKCAERRWLCPTFCLQMIACYSSALMGHKRWQSSVDLPGTTRAHGMMDCNFLKVPFFNIGVTYVYIQYSSLFVSYICMFILKTV